MLKIMEDIDAFCRANSIPYTISDGTMLGAVRHGGFIPWDDDLDILMLREDFDRFVATYPSDRYHLLFNARGDEEYFVDGYAKVCDPSTTYSERRSKTKYGVFVDVFPLDAVPADPKERQKYMHKIRSLHNRLWHRQQSDLNSRIKTYRHSLDWWWERAWNFTHRNLHEESGIVAQCIGASHYKVVFPRQLFSTLKDIDFAGLKLQCLADTHNYLEMRYGPDYMTPVQWAHDYTVYAKE